MDIVERAKVFATAAHAAVGQVRKYTFEPYIVHPTEVASIVASVPHTDEMMAAAYLHDVVEDTGVSLALIDIEFGKEIGALVESLTDISTPEIGNRAFRKSVDLVHTAKASPAAKTIKLADIISNCTSIMEHDADFAKVYLQEKRKSLEVLTEGDPELFNRAKELLGV